MLSQKTIIVGVTGGIAAYKSCMVVSALRKLGANVFVIMTKNATEFVTPLTFETLSGNPVACGMFDPKAHYEVEHISLAQRANLFLIVPASANLVAKYAHGICDDMLTTTLLATIAPVMLAPSMNTNMINHAAYVQNEAILRQRGVHFIESAHGRLACGDVGKGRLPEPDEIVARVVDFFAHKEYSGKNILISLGATEEEIDGVRLITNKSSGKMGAALAKAAFDAGASVLCVAARIDDECAKSLSGICKALNVRTTEQMHKAVIENIEWADYLILAAAPCDYRLSQPITQKLKADSVTLQFSKNADIAAAVGKQKGQKKLVIFAAETQDLIENAKKKLINKNADMCVANDVTKEGAGFGTDTNIASIITANEIKHYPLMKKSELAKIILKQLRELE